MSLLVLCALLLALGLFPAQHVHAGGGGGGGGGSSGAESPGEGATGPGPSEGVTGEWGGGIGEPVYTEPPPPPPTPPTCTVSTTCGITTNADCSTSGTYDPLLPGCRPTLPTQCRPESSCGVSILADCSTIGTYDSSLPGCSAATPSGCGPGTLNDQCTDVSNACAGQPVSIQCAPEPPCTALGYLFTQVGDSCVFNRCADGWQQVGNQCVLSQCPQGYVRQGNTCVAGCQPGYFYCGTGADEGKLYQRSYTGAPACLARDLLYAVCDHGCNAARGVCNPTPQTGATITARPALVRAGATTQITWQAASVHSCVITGGNGERWGCVGSACASGSGTSQPIQVQTSFMLSCRVDGQPNVVKNAVVNVLPIFREQ